jgi:hypothetical protein
MDHMAYYLTLSITSVIGTGIITLAALKGFHSWLDLKKAELDSQTPAAADKPATSVGNKIELADLKERIRKLEAIAAGVDL